MKGRPRLTRAAGAAVGVQMGGKMGITTKFESKVRADVRRAVRSALAALTAHVPVRHKLTVHVVPNPSVTFAKAGASRGFGFGVFIPKPRRIVLAAGLADIVKPRRDGLKAVVETLCHELVHYEQFRDGRPLNHRNVGRRTQTLVKWAKP